MSIYPSNYFDLPSIRTSTAQDLITRRHHAILRPKAVLRREAHTHREYTMAGTNPTSREAHRGWSTPSSTHTPVQKLRLPSSSSHPSPYPHQPSWSSQLLTPQRTCHTPSLRYVLMSACSAEQLADTRRISCVQRFSSIRLLCATSTLM